MPIGFLTDAERDRLNRFPIDIAPTDLLAYFTLSEPDLEFIQTRRGDHNRLGHALQLLALRLLGFAPDDLSTAPRRAVAYVALQLGVSTSALAQYGDRIHTRTDHLREIQAYVGFRDPRPPDFDALLSWLTERAMEHDRPLALLHMSCEWFRHEKIVRPGVTRLERVVARAREMAQAETFRRMEPLLTPEVCDKLDAALVPDPSTGRTRLAWLQREATAITPSAILFEIGKLTALRAIGAQSWHLEALAPNRRRLLSRIGQRATNQALQRMPPERRYPIMLAFLHQAFDDTTDEVVDLFDRCLATAYARAGRELEEFRRSIARSTNEKVLLFRELGRLVLDATVTDDRLRAQIYQKVSPDELEAAVAEADRIVRPLDDNYFDLLAQRYSYLRQCVPAFLGAFDFRCAPVDQGLLDAIAVLRQLDRTGRRRVPDNAPIDFVPSKWRRYVFGDQDRIDRRYYELSALWELRAALRAGDVWLDHGRRYADPETHLIPRERWPELRPEALRLTGLPEAGSERLTQRAAELNGVLDRLDRGLPSNDQLRLVGDDLTISPVKGEDLPESAEQLQEQVAERLPKLELADLLIEVDAWTGFTHRFEHAGGADPRTKDLLTHLHAVIFANACNFGLGQMADIAELSYRKLAWCSTWYLREDTLKAAIAQIVNYQHRLALAQFWGGGTLSSSDGQRFPVPVKSRHSTALPRYFGFRRGITHYTWTSDQYSPYGTKVIPSTVRDATYVLDEILDNETELPIEEHTTDTAGYSELIFALFDLLGMQFSPRIRDMADQQLYRADRRVRYEHIEPLFSGTINHDLILGRWDDLVRLAASLKMGWATASLLVGKLQSHRRQNAVLRALQEYGRLIKTVHIVRCLDSPEYRKRIGIQLNKGESLHDLRRFLFFANEGEIRRAQHEDQTVQALCLNLVTNAVITWNTVYMTKVLDVVRADGIPVRDEDMAHLAPTLRAHINPYGKYSFDVEGGLARSGFRPLREPSAAASA